MTRLKDRDLSELPQVQAMINEMEANMGYAPNNIYTIAYWPEFLGAFGNLLNLTMQGGEIEPPLKQMIALVSSAAAGCRYCQAHTATSAGKMGVSEEKIQAVYEFESSPLFDDRERSALRLAWHAGLQPNACEDSDFEEAGRHFSERQIVEIMAVVSLFGFLNRWNDSFATTLEDTPIDFASRALGDQGWERGNH